jgi:oxygen-independent coproporphyrinogen-3 oxidase
MGMIQRAQDEALGVYVSVPFCRAKCTFCNFASGVGNERAVASYLEALVREIERARQEAAAMGAVLPERVDTVYFGGGTPSLLAPDQLTRIFAALRDVFAMDAAAEITMEAAPGQIPDDLLERAMREGVNRVSLGVQTFVDREAAAVGRTHSGANCLAEFARLRAAGIADVGADLIAGLPLQTAESWERSLDALADAELAHASVYMFEVDEDSRLGAEVLRGGTRFGARDTGGEELAAAMYERACVRLPAMGFAQYEISNFARVGFASRHNRKYWERAPYVGFGLDAHSMLRHESGGDLRFANGDELAGYGFGARTVPQRIGTGAAFEESLFLGLRVVAGVRVEQLTERFGAERVRSVRGVVREMVEGGLMRDEGDRWALTVRGRLVSNEVFGRLLEDAVTA